MTTKDIVEAMLYINKSTYKAFRIGHVINDRDRNWKAKQHDEYIFLKAFTNPKFLIIIEKQIHIYIIGDKFDKRKYNIINLEGHHADHMVLSKNELIGEIKATYKNDTFLPANLYERIIYIDNGSIGIFNRFCGKGTLFSKSEWTVGVDMYSMDAPRYTKSGHDILKEITDMFG